MTASQSGELSFQRMKSSSLTSAQHRWRRNGKAIVHRQKQKKTKQTQKTFADSMLTPKWGRGSGSPKEKEQTEKVADRRSSDWPFGRSRGRQEGGSLVACEQRRVSVHLLAKNRLRNPKKDLAGRSDRRKPWRHLGIRHVIQRFPDAAWERQLGTACDPPTFRRQIPTTRVSRTSARARNADVGQAGRALRPGAPFPNSGHRRPPAGFSGPKLSNEFPRFPNVVSRRR